MNKRKIIGGICLLLAFAGLYKAVPDTLQNDYVISYTIGRFLPMVLLLVSGIWLLFTNAKVSINKNKEEERKVEPGSGYNSD